MKQPRTDEGPQRGQWEDRGSGGRGPAGPGGGRGRGGGGGGRGGRGGGAEGEGDAQRFYKPTFSMDPWKQLPGGNIPVVRAIPPQRQHPPPTLQPRPQKAVVSATPDAGTEASIGGPPVDLPVDVPVVVPVVAPVDAPVVVPGVRSRAMKLPAAVVQQTDGAMLGGAGKKSLADLMEESAMEAEVEGDGAPSDRFTVQAADDRPWH